MFDKMMEKLIANAAATYMPKVGQIALERKSELERMRSKILTDPEEVQAWFEKEIRKLESINVGDILTHL